MRDREIQRDSTVHDSVTAALCVFAHPDDELYTAGLLAHLVTHGVAVHLLCMTRGEHGAPGMPRIPAGANLGEIRAREMACAARTLGAKNLTFMDYVDRLDEDGGMTEPAHDPQQLQAELLGHIDCVAPQLVLTHGSDGEYGHPAHKLLHRMVKQTIMEQGIEGPMLYSFQADFPGHPFPDEVNVSDPAHVLVDVSHYQESHVLPMLECHWTQASWWAHMKSEKLQRPVTIQDAWRRRPVEGLHRHVPPVSGQPLGHDVFLAWLSRHS